MNNKICVAFLVLIMGSSAALANEISLTVTQQKANGEPVVLQKFDVPGTNYQAGMGIVTLAPNAEKTRHIHSWPEVAYVLEGEYFLQVDRHPVKIFKAGDSLQIPTNVFHVTKAGPKGAKILATWLIKQSS